MLIQYENDHGDIKPYGRNVAIGYSGVTGSQSSIFSFTDAGFDMSALQGNTFDREYTAEVSADG
jgi:hypothetical protein